MNTNLITRLKDMMMSSSSFFSPPLWLQRRALASRILHDFSYTKLLDLGCGEGALLEILSNSGDILSLILTH